MTQIGIHTGSITQGNLGLGFLPDVFTSTGYLASGYIYVSNPTYPWFLLTFSVALSLVLAVFLLNEPKNPET